MKGRKGKRGNFSPYPKSFRMEVARDYLEGPLSYQEVAEKYGLKGRETVKEWVKVFRKKSDLCTTILAPMTEEEQQEQAALKKRIKELEAQLKQERLRSLAYDTMIEVAEEELGIEIRKKSGTKRSNG